MKVKDLLKTLTACDPEAEIVIVSADRDGEYWSSLAGLEKIVDGRNDPELADGVVYLKPEDY